MVIRITDYVEIRDLRIGRPIRIRFESDEPIRKFQSAAHAVCRHTTNYAHSLFNKNINLFAVCS